MANTNWVFCWNSSNFGNIIKSEDIPSPVDKRSGFISLLLKPNVWISESVNFILSICLTFMISSIDLTHFSIEVNTLFNISKLS